MPNISTEDVEQCNKTLFLCYCFLEHKVMVKDRQSIILLGLKWNSWMFARQTSVKTFDKNGYTKQISKNEVRGLKLVLKYVDRGNLNTLNFALMQYFSYLRGKKGEKSISEEGFMHKITEYKKWEEIW